ncbi:VCBS repeat-containing protein [uncultured Streptomyces sp.]|uniref:FG-GAP repeat domain-containing protein n=1 Tax=uncultured Streptomyces sp. TaxID=174707 RepID=UPI002603224D|nr:VCBS repeat-containing protein [uncultured Streptomyces sp.]
MPNPARPGRRWPRRAAAAAVLGCAGLLVSGSLTITAHAAGTDGEVPRTVTSPRPTAERPEFSIPKSPAAARQGRSLARSAAVAPAQRADFDGDGTGDFVYRMNYGEVYVDWGYGGTTAIAAGDAQVKDLLLPGDLTGDGLPDLLTLTATGALRLHNGASATYEGGLTGYTTLSNGWQAYNKLVIPGDLSGDGKPDLLARSTAGLYLFPGTGTGFGKGVKVGGAGWSQFDQLVGADDLTGDGLADLVTRNASGLYVYPGNGSSTGYPFKDRIQIGGAGWNQYNQLVGGTDYNGNGTADLLVRGFDGTLYYYDGKGTGTFLDRSKISGGWGVVTLFASGGTQPSFGKSGVFARTANGTLYYYEGTGTGKLEAKYLIGTGWTRSEVRLSHVVSLRGTGDSDLIQHSVYNGHLYNSASYAADDTDLAAGSKSYNLIVGPGDLNGDGKSDLIARSSTALYYYAGNGDGLSMKGRVQVGGGGWSQYNKLVGAGDFNRDGRADLIARSSAGLFFYPGTGKAAAPFGTRITVGGAGWSQYTNLAAPGDINGDGIPDLLASNSKGQLFFYAGTGVAKTPFKARVQIGTGGWNQYPDLT